MEEKEKIENPPAFPTFDWNIEPVNDRVVLATDYSGMSLRD